MFFKGRSKIGLKKHIILKEVSISHVYYKFLLFPFPFKPFMSKYRKRSDNMIVGTGIDIIEISRIKTALSRFKERFVQILYTEAEKQYCLTGSNKRAQAVKFAGRFAAKEAFLKALGTGLRDGIKWSDIEILNDKLGKPYVNVKNIAKNKLQEIKADQIHISISHCLEYATAFVILEQTM